MSFEGEFASYEPLRRILESNKVKELQERFKIREKVEEDDDFNEKIIHINEVRKNNLKPDLVIAFDGSNLTAKAMNGYPGAEFGYITVASVIIFLSKIAKLEKEKFIDPKKFRETEEAATIDTVFPGCNVILDNEKSAKASLRKALFESLANTGFDGGESLLETYEYLFSIKRANFSTTKLPKSPIEDYADQDMTYGMGEYTCPHSGESLYSTDALRLHELMNPGGSNGEMFGQIMATIEKLVFVNFLRTFEKVDGWLSTLRRVAFILDGPLAVFSTSSWLAKVISYEIKRINHLQKKINDTDLLIVGIEKSGNFFNHFLEIDTTKDGITDKFPEQSVLLLDDDYIKNNIIFSESKKPYGLDTYFGRKFFYKTASGQKIVPVIASYNDYEHDLRTANPNQFARLGDVMELLDKLVSNQYPNSISPLISAHAEAALPLNLGKRIFEDIAREIRETTNG
ncbi:DNA double-strand break repair nuclease NurA [Microscilla marina]|uniref:NurA domain-containing protein n=1 Tax=Microscilla marina ATCC 23134 TaxID=313606 RepID=A1ZJW0_MICM2|nr:DNA double-strand break repair nuclease NurA [Microscilla marina]EAY29413.1 conserved hypothetical protein [Microscilla marina ATCC 23134]